MDFDANAPKHNVNLFGRYVVQDRPLKDLGLSLGLLYNRRKAIYDAYASGPALLKLPGYTIVEAGLSYSFGNWGAQLNVADLFDKRYFPDACCIERVTPWRAAQLAPDAVAQFLRGAAAAED